MPNTIDNKNLFLDTQFQQFVQFAETATSSGLLQASRSSRISGWRFVMGMKDALMARAKEVKENMDSLLVGVPSKTGKTTVKTRNENWQLCFVIFGEPVQKKEAVQA